MKKIFALGLTLLAGSALAQETGGATRVPAAAEGMRHMFEFNLDSVEAAALSFDKIKTKGQEADNGTNLDLLSEFYIESAYVTNKWGPTGGYKDLVIITDIQNAGNIYQPYWDPGYFNYSSYPTFNIVFQDDPVGSNGPLSSDTYLAKIGATQLKFAFNERVSQEIQQSLLAL